MISVQFSKKKKNIHASPNALNSRVGEVQGCISYTGLL